MSIEPTCSYCGASDKGRCKTLEQAAKCSQYFEHNEDKKGVDHDFDFGFTEPVDLETITAATTVQTTKVQELTKANKSLDNKLHTLYNTIIPFLDRLQKGGEKDIHWPNRAQQITEFKQKLSDIVEGKK